MSEISVPETLYHGSLYKQKELMPGFKRSGKLVHWDGVESNQYLYTTTDKAEAVSLGFGSALEKTLDSRRYATFDDIIVIYFAKELPNVETVCALKFYVYSIATRDEHEWVKNSNPFNNITTEWITQNTIRHIKRCEEVDVKKWLSTKHVYLTTSAVDSCPKKLISGTRWHDNVVKL